MTSNLGSQWLVDLAPRPPSRGGKGANDGQRETGVSEEAREHVMEALREHFRPEFLNRVDEVIVFETLGRQELGRIVELQLDKLAQRLADRHITVEFTEPAKQLLIDEGYDPVYGARPLKRTIQRRVLDPLALQVLEGRFRDGDHVVVGINDGQLSFTAAERAPEPEPVPAGS